METMSGHTRLMRRKATYYHRAKVPLDILDTYGKSEETFSLKTKDYQEALRLIKVAAVETDKKFEAHRSYINRPTKSTLTDLELEHLKQVAIRSLLEENDASRSHGYDQTEERLTTVLSFHNASEEGLKEINKLIQEIGFKNDLEENIEGTKAALSNIIYKHSRGEVDITDEMFLEEMLELEYINIRLATNSPSARPAMVKLQEAQIEAYQIIVDRFAGNYLPTEKLSKPLPEASVVKSSPTSGAPSISKVAKEWIKEKSRSEWKPKTKTEHQIWINHFINFSGDKPIDSYSKEDGRAFKAMLLSLPSNWKKKKDIKTLSILKASEKAAKIGLLPMSDANVNKIVAKVAAFWNWARKSYDEIQGNPLADLQIRIKRNARDEREPFTKLELNTLFSSPLYLGCQSDTHPHMQGDLILIDTAKYWTSLISLYSGMRMGEILQLYTSDIRQEDDIHYFDLNLEHSDKALKTASSERKIPIHAKLIEHGLLDFIDRKPKTANIRLFPEIKQASDGYYSTNFSKWFNRYLAQIKIKHNKLSFHSFRHNFEDACRSARVDKAVMDALQGHTDKAMSGRYGRGYELKLLNEDLQKIQYEHLLLHPKP